MRLFLLLALLVPKKYICNLMKLNLFYVLVQYIMQIYWFNSIEIFWMVVYLSVKRATIFTKLIFIESSIF